MKLVTFQRRGRRAHRRRARRERRGTPAGAGRGPRRGRRAACWRCPSDMRGLLAAGEAAHGAAARALAFAARPENAALRRPLAGVRLRAPLLPGKILGVGRNYADHAKEVGGPKLAAPRIFLKPTSSVSGPGDVVRIPAAALKPDWEVELAVGHRPHRLAGQRGPGARLCRRLHRAERPDRPCPAIRPADGDDQLRQGSRRFLPDGPLDRHGGGGGGALGARPDLLAERRRGAARQYARPDLPASPR